MIDSCSIIRECNIHSQIKFQRIGEFMKLRIASYLSSSPPPSRDTVFSEEVVGACLALQSHLWGRHRGQSDAGVHGSVFPDTWWFHSQEEQDSSCSSPASEKPPPWSPPAAIANRTTWIARTDCSNTTRSKAIQTPVENRGLHELAQLLSLVTLQVILSFIKRWRRRRKGSMEEASLQNYL